MKEIKKRKKNLIQAFLLALKINKSIPTQIKIIPIVNQKYKAKKNPGATPGDGYSASNCKANISKKPKIKESRPPTTIVIRPKTKKTFFDTLYTNKLGFR
jgi:hypothetical protein